MQVWLGWQTYSSIRAPATAASSPTLEAAATLLTGAADFLMPLELLGLADDDAAAEEEGFSRTTPPLTLAGFLTSAFFDSSLYFFSV